MKLSRIIEKVVLTPWMITPGGYSAVKALIDAKLNGAELDIQPGEMEGTDMRYAVDANGIAHIEIFGTLGKRLSFLEKICGGTDYDDVENAINECADMGAKGYLFHIDSPGGMSTGCPELASIVAGIGEPKVTFTDGLCCSAAYFLASSCQAIYASQSAQVGSIGVIIPWADQSRAWAMEGVEFAPIVGDGDTLKSAFYGPSLSDEQRQHFQDSVNEMQAAFRSHVSEYRNLDYSQLKAGAYSGAKAKSLGLIDEIGTYADAYNELLSIIADDSTEPTSVDNP